MLEVLEILCCNINIVLLTMFTKINAKPNVNISLYYYVIVCQTPSVKLLFQDEITRLDTQNKSWYSEFKSLTRCMGESGRIVGRHKRLIFMVLISNTFHPAHDWVRKLNIQKVQQPFFNASKAILVDAKRTLNKNICILKVINGYILGRSGWSQRVVLKTDMTRQ